MATGADRGSHQRALTAVGHDGDELCSPVAHFLRRKPDGRPGPCRSLDPHHDGPLLRHACRYDDAELEMLVLMGKRLAIAEGDTALPPPGYSYDKAKESGPDAE
jgi:hypothetical protein